MILATVFFFNVCGYCGFWGRKTISFSVQPKTVSTTLAAAAAKNNNRNQNDDPAIVVAEERIKAAHCNASLHYLKIMKRWEDV